MREGFFVVQLKDNFEILNFLLLLFLKRLGRYWFKIIYFGAGFTPSYFINRQRIVNGQEFNYHTPLYYNYRSNGSWDYWLFGLQAKTGVAVKLNSNWFIRFELQVSSAGLGYGFYNLGFGLSIDYKIR